MKRVCLLFACVSGSLLAYCQSNAISNSLLWKISGNNLTRPSYLYGTMHVTDKKVFYLGDSLYRSIEMIEGFAGELDMNRVGMQLVNYMIAEKQARAATEKIRVRDAVAGPYSLDQKQYISTHDATGIYWSATYDALKIDGHFRDYLDKVKERKISPGAAEGVPAPPPAK